MGNPCAFRHAIALASAAGLTSCNNPPATDSDSQVIKNYSEIEFLRTRVDVLERQRREDEKRIRALELAQDARKLD